MNYTIFSLLFSLSSIPRSPFPVPPPGVWGRLPPAGRYGAASDHLFHLTNMPQQGGV